MQIGKLAGMQLLCDFGLCIAAHIRLTFSACTMLLASFDTKAEQGHEILQMLLCTVTLTALDL